MPKKDNLTPMMRQFFSLKEKHPDALLLFRCGDFYETYGTDAQEASRILGITLTRRSNGSKQDDNALMAGFPYHALDVYLPKLVRAGRRVAICDQLEDPKQTKKLVKRGITELVTPGVALVDNVLDGRQNNFLAAVDFGRGTSGAAFLDISTGEFLLGEGTLDYIAKLFANFSPKETLYVKGKRNLFEQHFGTNLCTFELDEWAFEASTARSGLLKHFGVKSLKGFGVDHLQSAITAAGAVFQYLDYTQHTQTAHITSLRRIEEERYVRLDRFTVNSLELVSSIRPGGVALLDVIDRTLTPMGSRLMRRHLMFPLKNAAAIRQRHDVVDGFFRETELRDALSEQLQQVADLERLIGKVSTKRISPRELQQVRLSLLAVKEIKRIMAAATGEALRKESQGLDDNEGLISLIEKTLTPLPPVLVAKGGVIREGVSEELDRLRRLMQNGKTYLQEIVKRETEATGIQSLKLGYNNVYGYYLEVRNTYKQNVPEGWTRKQTLTYAERYITTELKEYEEAIIGAQDKILSLETALYVELVDKCAPFIQSVQQSASRVASLDCLLSFAKAAKEHKYVRPQVSDESLEIDIRQGRHPVIETQMPVGEVYVPNDVLLDDKRQQIIMLTGPNMAGKSALLRQTALITLMAQMGSFVPAESAKIGLVDKIFTRVGASDNISLGESTFMVEMTEAANILNNVTNRSLVLFDELGRGTSTYDGISIAWAIVEYLHEHKEQAARTLFATHYHELNEMEKTFQRIKNYNVAVKEVDGKVVFLRRMERGSSEHSFGIHVARMAGMPPSIVRRAEKVLALLEREGNSTLGLERPDAGSIERSREGMQLNFFQLDDPVLCQIRDEIRGLDIDNLTPMEALMKLSEIKKILF